MELFLWKVLNSNASCMRSGDGHLTATSEVQNLPTVDAQTTQAWTPYHTAQQHGATDITDGPQIGHTQLYGIFCSCLMYMYSLFVRAVFGLVVIMTRWLPFSLQLSFVLIVVLLFYSGFFCYYLHQLQ